MACTETRVLLIGSLCRIMAVRGTVDMVRRARGKAASSENREMVYACFVMFLKLSPPTTYHGQESARGGHTGSNVKCDVRKVTILTAPGNGTTLTETGT